MYGFDTAGTFGEETLDASRQAPRGILSSIWISGIVGAVFLLAVILSFQDMEAAIAEGQAFGLPDRDDPHPEPVPGARRGITFGEIYLFVILASVFVCTLAIQGATTRLMFSMGRDRRPAVRRRVGARQPAPSRHRPTPHSRSASSQRSRSS